VNSLLVTFSLIHSTLFVTFPVSTAGVEPIPVKSRYHIPTVGLTRQEVYYSLQKHLPRSTVLFLMLYQRETGSMLWLANSDVIARKWFHYH
jgi:hypothetical protein